VRITIVAGARTIEKTITAPKVKVPTSQQVNLNGEVHNWYRLVHGYSDHLVKKLLDRFEIEPGEWVIDPFCGSGTTLVEAKKHGINAVGIDANPSSCFASRVKTNWSIQSWRLLELLEDVEQKQRRSLRYTHDSDPTCEYLLSSGMIKRGWISREPLRKAIAIKSSILNLATSPRYRNALLLALLSEVILGASNIKFGPELYCGKKKRDVDVFAGFEARVNQFANDLRKVSSLAAGDVEVFQGDSRKCYEILKTQTTVRYSAGICSPPYPTEHDYTRNSRLELAMLENVVDRTTLRAIKEQMIRSHTKNIYKDDNDSRLVEKHLALKKLVARLERKTKNLDHGFGRLYSTVVLEYFGGMRRHFKSMRKLLKPHAKCAYVVGDQASYEGVHIPTADILGSIAGEVGFAVLEIEHWRNRWSTSLSKRISENILILQKVKTR
jgi:hypothetical protein